LVALYDLRSEARLKSHVTLLREIGLANYVCGSIPPDDLADMDLIILSHEYPRDSSFLKNIDTEKISVEYPESLFFRLAPPVTVVGVMGSCGKSTVISMLAPMLEQTCGALESQGFFVVDPDSTEGALAHLKKIKSGDLLLIRVTENVAKELHALRISPHVAVFASMPGQTSGSESLFDILAFQTYNNFIIASDEVIDAVRSKGPQARAKMLRTKSNLIPTDWGFQGKSTHDRENAALALQAARLFKVSDEVAQEALISWKPLRGHLELVKKVKSVEFYNDTAAVTAYATEAGIRALAIEKNIVLVFGGAGGSTDNRALYAFLPQHVHTVVLVPGSGTMRERVTVERLEHIEAISAPSVEEAARLALEHAKKGDRVLFSPGFEAGGFDRSRKERGERFVKAVRAL
jgi:UDP-N-acetylmuramoylalanine-D-glutamate ligase